MKALAAAVAAACIVGAGALGGCAGVPVAPPVTLLLHDELLDAATGGMPPADPGSALALSDAMRRFVEGELGKRASWRDARQALVEAMGPSGPLRLRYDAGTTRNAAETFDARAGNCLSLVLMTAALARHLNIPVTFQSVSVDDSYSRVEQLHFVSGHVNVVLGRPVPTPMATRPADAGPSGLVVDFLPGEQLQGQRAEPIDERTVVAMYFNNRAAEALARGDMPGAYRWARAAVLHQPDFLAGINTLAVVYTRLGHFRPAETALRHVLARHGDNLSAMTNLVGVLERSGRAAEARGWADRLTRLQPHPPFHFLDLGRQALDAGDPAAARGLLLRELELQPHQHEVHFWLAVAHGRLGQLHHARRHLRLALENSTTAATHDLYAGKLERLRSASVQ